MSAPDYEHMTDDELEAAARDAKVRRDIGAEIRADAMARLDAIFGVQQARALAERANRITER